MKTKRAVSQAFLPVFPPISSLLSSHPVSLFPSLYPLPPSSYGWLARYSAGHLHGVGDRADSLGAVGMGASPRAGPVHGAGAGQGGRPGASQAGHTGGWHWEEGGKGWQGGQFSITFCKKLCDELMLGRCGEYMLMWRTEDYPFL